MKKKKRNSKKGNSVIEEIRRKYKGELRLEMEAWYDMGYEEGLKIARKEAEELAYREEIAAMDRELVDMD